MLACVTENHGSAHPRDRLVRELSLVDAAMLVVASVIGAGIFEMAPTVAACTGGWGAVGIWLVGGVLALTGALSYAELSTVYPREGED